MKTYQHMALIAFAATTCLGSIAMAQETTTITVRVMTGGANSQPLASTPVVLRAARPKGPFEPKDPTPVHEWKATTNSSGQAKFDKVPTNLSQKGLRLHAIATYKKMPFKSRVIVPVNDATLDVPVFEKTDDLSVLQIRDWRMYVKPAEGFLVFSQQFKLQVKGDRALDTDLLKAKGIKYEKGLPITLPVKARGLKIFGSGTHQAIESTVYWTGILQPGTSVNLQVNYYMSISESTFVYEQTLPYPIIGAEIIVPLVTQFRKMPRLNNLELAAIGFKAEAKEQVRVPTFPQPVEVLYAQLTAKDRTIAAGAPVKVQIKGLPYEKAKGPWIALGLGILGFFLVLVAGAQAKKKHHAKISSKHQYDALQREKEALYEELALLEDELRRNEISDVDYEIESMAIRERLALVLKKIEDFDQA